MLSDDQLREEWKSPGKEVWKSWLEGYQALLNQVQAMTESEIRSPEGQKLLWNARAMTSVGQWGEQVRVDGAYSDPEVVNAVLALRQKAWPVGTKERASALQQAYDALLELIMDRQLASARPLAKLLRLFAVLRPADFHCCLAHQARQHLNELLLPPGSRPGVVESHVLVRARLREVLGPERDLAWHVTRSTFCWRLNERHKALTTGSPSVEEVGKPPVEPEKSPITLWPFGKQKAGLNYLNGAIELLRDFLRLSIEGITREQLIEAVSQQEEYAGYARSSLIAMYYEFNRLGMFKTSPNGLLIPSDVGLELLESENLDVLVERILERVFGMAHLLRFVQETPGGMSREQILEHFQRLYPQWTSPHMPMRLATWTQVLGLLERSGDQRLCLTKYGQSWADRLPTHLLQPPKPLVVQPIIGEEETFPPPKPAGSPLAFPTREEILESFEQDHQHFVFDRAQLETLHAAWHCNPRKRFVLLSGLSGTGKTQVTLLYSRIVCELLGLEDRLPSHRAVIAVSPDWRDPSGLLGYLNALHEEPTFQLEPALRLVLAAARDPARPYFLILDEMNLARVERYFAPFLSAMETGEDLVLHAHEGPVNGVPPRITWPTNLFVAGTVNMDETTHPFSDKVLDRAFTLEFWDVDLASYFERQAQGANRPRWPMLEQLLIELNALLRPIRRHFGYRTAGKILSFVHAAVGSSEEPAPDVIDYATFAKVLPRLRGDDDERNVKALEALHKRCSQARLRRCEAKLEALLHQVRHRGQFGFWA